MRFAQFKKWLWDKLTLSLVLAAASLIWQIVKEVKYDDLGDYGCFETLEPPYIVWQTRFVVSHSHICSEALVAAPRRSLVVSVHGNS